ncbi:MAG TPA: tetratricopeptide repeat protein, partial [Gemmatimonadaceae bacterium]
RFNPYIGGLKAAWLAEDDRAMAVAEREYRQLIQTFPDSFAPPNQLGDVLTRQQRWDDAFKLFDDRLKTRPNEGIALFGLGKAASLSGRRMEEGISTLTRYLTLPVPPGAPTHAAAHYRIGVIEQRRGNTDAARREYQAALNLNPRYEDAKRALASLP